MVRKKFTHWWADPQVKCINVEPTGYDINNQHRKAERLEGLLNSLGFTAVAHYTSITVNADNLTEAQKEGIKLLAAIL